MATQEVTIKSQLEGLYKEVYGEKVENLIPENAKLVKLIPFRDAEKLGEVFHMPVILTDEQGVTYAGSDEDAFTLEKPEAMTTKPARLKGSQLLIRSAIGYKAAAAAVKGGPKAFLNATELVIKRMMASLTKRLEIALLYGGSGLGRIDGFTNVSATETTVDFPAGQFAPGIWVGSQCARIDVYDSAGVLVVADLQVGRVNIKDKKINITGAGADITTLEAALGALVGSDYLDIFFKGAKDKEMLGLDKIITTNGSLFGIDNSIYDLHKGQEFDVQNGQLTFDKLTDALVCAIKYGLQDDVSVFVSPETWQDLNNDEAALREYDASYSSSKAEKGVNAIVYNHAGIKMEVMHHPMVKEGDAFMFAKKKLRRVGAWPESMRTPGYGGEIFRQLDDQAAFELRAYTDQALFVDHVSHCVKLFNIVNS